MPHKELPQPEPGFVFTENERLYYRVNSTRFRKLFEDEQTEVHRIELSSNSYGEFLFITLSHRGQQVREPVTFYSLGYHDYRERWIHQEWYWYTAHPYPTTTQRVLDKDEAQEMLMQRQQEIAQYVDQDTQTRRGQLYEMLAELTDEDGAIAEMDDLGPLIDDIDDLGT